MRTTLFISASLLAASASAGCAPKEFEQRKLNDGSYEFTCQMSMDACVRRVQDICDHQRFRIIEGTSETRLRDAPPFEQAYHTSRLRLQCTHDGADVLLSVDKSNAGAPPKSSCTRGETRSCVGAAACKGGQTCLPDGSGFGACDCGPAAAAPANAAPAAPPEPVSPPANNPSTLVNPAPAPTPAVPPTMPPAQPLSP